MSGFRILFLFAFVCLFAVAPVWAGPLTPSGPPASSSVTLNELDEKIDDLGKGNIRPSNPDNNEIPESVRPVIDETVNWGALLFVEGSVSGPIEGSVSEQGVEGGMAVIGMSHGVSTERDAASGLPTGKRQHKPVSITKPIDKATPLLFNALVNNEALTSVEIQFFRDGRDGKDGVYYTIELENASIASMETALPNYEEVSFTYQKIIVTWEEGGITAEDDWETPQGK